MTQQKEGEGDCRFVELINSVERHNKENNVFKDGIGVKGLRFKLHGINHGKHYGNLFGNYHNNHGNHLGNHGLWTLID